MSDVISLPDAEWFVLYDLRFDFQLLYATDASPDVSITQYDAESGMSAVVRRRRIERCLERDPSWSIGRDEVNYLFEDDRQEFTDDLLAPVSWFHARVPRPMPHYDLILDFCAEPHGYQTEWTLPVVSSFWRSALERHGALAWQFFSHTLQFQDGMICDHSIFRERQINFIDFVRSPRDPWCRTGIFRGEILDTVSPKEGLVGRRSALAGHHWVRQLGSVSRFASRALALELNLLLPSPTFFIPMTLSNA